jgi:carbamoyltransferase
MWRIVINIKDGAIALLKNNNLQFFLQEERLSKFKYDNSPYLSMEIIAEYLEKQNLSVSPKIIITGARKYYEIPPNCHNINKIVNRKAVPIMSWTGENPYCSIMRKKIKDRRPWADVEDDIIKINQHFSSAATSFMNSPFSDSAIIVIDSFGNGFDCHRYANYLKEHYSIPVDVLANDTWELESIWSVHIDKFTKYYSNYGSNTINSKGTIIDDEVISEISNNCGIIKSFEAVNSFLNFHHNDITKTMFLSAYGKENSRIVVNNNLLNNSKLIKTVFPKSSTIVENYDTELFKNIHDHSWHDDPNLMDEYKKDLAYAVQESAFSRLCNLIEKTKDLTGSNNITITGKINYNYRINYRILKKFPNITFYHDMLSHFGGDFFGSFSQIMEPIESLYLGPNIDNYYLNQSFDGFTLIDTSSTEIAKLIANGNIVALFQGRSEIGPNALGNRSILFDPTVSNGKKILSKLKNKKWFESYSASCLLDFAHDWFDMAGLKESPFMMYAVDVIEDKKSLIPNVVHYDGSCLLQTVTHDQNSNLYALLVEFNKIKNVPILLNTGFHLENSPLVETLKDAIFTIEKLDINYLWLPDINKLAVKKINDN